MTQGAIHWAAERNSSLVLTTATVDANGVVGIGTIHSYLTSTLAGSSDYVVTCMAQAGVTTLLNPAAVSWVSPGRYDYELSAAYFDGSHKLINAYFYFYTPDGVTLKRVIHWELTDEG